MYRPYTYLITGGLIHKYNNIILPTYNLYVVTNLQHYVNFIVWQGKKDLMILTF